VNRVASAAECHAGTHKVLELAGCIEKLGEGDIQEDVDDVVDSA
jgi:hypothetical protein